MNQVAERAYAKINLFLDVTARRENGYHEIDGVMQSVSLCDLVTVSYVEAEDVSVSLTAEGNPDMPTDGRNIAVKAAKLFLETFKKTGRVEIFIQKRIPMAGGLAGGSTDAAAVLRALNRLFGEPFTAVQLCEMGANLGADVPFCIRGGTMRTQGIGEILTPLSPMPNAPIVIAKRGEGVSTPWAYGRLDALYGNFASGADRPVCDVNAMLSALDRQNVSEICGAVYNLFEPVVSEQQGDVQILRKMMNDCGAVVSRMSGSGPSVFGIFPDEASACTACEALRANGAEAHICEPIAL